MYIYVCMSVHTNSCGLCNDLIGYTGHSFWFAKIQTDTKYPLAETNCTIKENVREQNKSPCACKIRKMYVFAT